MNKTNFFLFFCALLNTFGPTLTYAADAYDPTDDLDAAFGSQCASSGALTEAALSQSDSLKSVIASIQNDPACKGVQSDALDTDLQQIQQNKIVAKTGQLNQQQLQSTILDDTAAIQNEQTQSSPDQDYISALQTNLATTQANYLTAQQTNQQANEQISAAKLASVSAHGTAFMDALSANGTCMNAHPNALAQVGAQILKVSSSWAPGIVGSSMLATGGLVDHFVQAVSNAGINDKLKIISSSRMQHAIGCTFEGLASTYCNARDLMLVQKANQEAQANACNTTNTVSEGINLLSRDLKSFQDFVNNIHAGSAASSNGTAAEKISVATLQAGLQNLGYTLQGATATYQKNYDTSKTQADKDNAVRNLIRVLSSDVKNNLNVPINCTGGVCSGGTTGAIGDNFSDVLCGPTVFYYTNGASNSCTPNANESTNPCELCIARVYFKSTDENTLPPLPTIAQVTKSSSGILDLGTTYVSQQELLYKQDNPQDALTSSETYGTNMRKGKQFLENTDTYLTHLLNADPQDSIAQGQMLKTITNAKERVESVLKTLNDSAKDPNADPGAVNVQLEALLSPSTDQAYIPTQIQLIVKQDLDTKMSKGKIDPSLAAVLQTSTSDSISELLSNYSSLEALRNQVRETKRMTKDNLAAVGELFNPQINNMLRSMASQVAINPSDSDLKDDLSLFCMQTLLVPPVAVQSDGKKKKDTDKDDSIASICKGRVYKSLYPKAKLDLNYDQLAAEPFEARACSLYDFYRKSTLYGNGVRSPSSTK